MERAMVQTAKFWDKTALSYSRSPIRNEESYRKKLEATRKYFKEDSEVLEFGCGTGTTAVAHAPFVKHILAIDISSKMLEIGQDKADAENIANISFQQFTIESFSSAGKQFDVVMGHNILHLLDNPQAAISKVYDLLNPGGFFVSSTACIGDANLIWKLVLPVGRFFRAIPYVEVFSKEELDGMIAKAGFEITYQWGPRKGEAAFIVAQKPA